MKVRSVRSALSRLDLNFLAHFCCLVRKLGTAVNGSSSSVDPRPILMYQEEEMNPAKSWTGLPAPNSYCT